MKDQCEHVADTRPSSIMQEIKKTKECMDGIFKRYDSWARRKPKLNELINIDNRFYIDFDKLFSCLEEINFELENMHADDMLSQQDLQDKIYISIYDDSLSGRG